MSFIATWFVVSLLAVGCFGQTFVPLVPVQDITNTTLQEGAFTPNGTLASGMSSASYYVNVSSVPKGYGLSVYVQYLSGPIYGSTVGVTLYLKRGQNPSALNYDQILDASCLDTPCNYNFPPSIGECSPSNGNWYFSIANNGNTSVDYILFVAIDTNGGDFFGCGDNGLSTLIIIIIIVSVVVFVGVVGGVICCCCCCCAAGAAGVAVAAASYQPVPDYRPTTIQQQPVYGNPNNIQYNPNNTQKV